MPKEEFIAGLDLGSSQVVCVMGRKDAEERIEVIGATKIPCRGLKGGVVVDITDTTHAIEKAVNETQEKSGEDIESVYVAVRGEHIQSQNNEGKQLISRTDKEITQEDVDNAIESAKAIQLSPDREIIHVVTKNYSLDHQAGVTNPVGMEGSHLAVEVHIITASKSHLNNMYKCINQAGVKVEELLLGVFAVGEVTITPDEKDLGVLLVDLGGETTNLAVYHSGSVCYTEELKISSDYITRDLSYGLRTSAPIARQIKEKHGAALFSVVEDENEEVTYLGVDGRTQRHISRKTLVEYIQPRVEEIFSFIRESVQNSGYIDIVHAGGAILVGGGSLLSGVTQAAEQILSMPVRTGLPLEIGGISEIINDPSYSTAVGLLKYPQIIRGSSNRSNPRGNIKKSGSFKSISNWIKETF